MYTQRQEDRPTFLGRLMKINTTATVNTIDDNNSKKKLHVLRKPDDTTGMSSTPLQFSTPHSFIHVMLKRCINILKAQRLNKIGITICTQPKKKDIILYPKFLNFIEAHDKKLF